MKKITVKRNGLDVNGNKKYLYNFIDTDSTIDQKEINRLFSHYGRLTKNGLSSQNNKDLMQEWLGTFGSFLGTTTSKELTRAQKTIDSCNSKRGCNVFCSSQIQQYCWKIKQHAELMEQLSYIKSFLKLEIEEI